MKSDKSIPNMHMTMPSGKPNHPIAPASAGTSQKVGMSHDADIALAEGLAQGSVHSGHKKEKVRDAKHVKGLQMAAQAAHVRRENGGADPNGAQ